MKISLWGMAFYAFIFVASYSNISEGDSSGVSKDKKLDKVIDQDAKKMCDSYRKDAKEIRKGNCTLDGLVQGKDKKDCKEIRDNCLKAIDAKSTDSNECTELDITEFVGCNVTVGEIESCFSQLVAYAKDRKCNEFGNELSPPPNCIEDLRTRCGGTP